MLPLFYLEIISSPLRIEARREKCPAFGSHLNWKRRISHLTFFPLSTPHLGRLLTHDELGLAHYFSRYFSSSSSFCSDMSVAHVPVCPKLARWLVPTTAAARRRQDPRPLVAILWSGYELEPEGGSVRKRTFVGAGA